MSMKFLMCAGRRGAVAASLLLISGSFLALPEAEAGGLGSLANAAKKLAPARNAGNYAGSRGTAAAGNAMRTPPGVPPRPAAVPPPGRHVQFRDPIARTAGVPPAAPPVPAPRPGAVNLTPPNRGTGAASTAASASPVRPNSLHAPTMATGMSKRSPMDLTPGNRGTGAASTAVTATPVRPNTAPRPHQVPGRPAVLPPAAGQAGAPVIRPGAANRNAMDLTPANRGSGAASTAVTATPVRPDTAPRPYQVPGRPAVLPPNAGRAGVPAARPNVDRNAVNLTPANRSGGAASTAASATPQRPDSSSAQYLKSRQNAEGGGRTSTLGQGVPPSDDNSKQYGNYFRDRARSGQ